MNKIMKFMPVCLIVASAASGCSSRNGLAGFVAGLSEGEHTQEQIEGIYADDIINSGDAFVKSSSYQYRLYQPYWVFDSTATEEELAANVERRDDIKTFKSYDNGVVETSLNSTVYPYDKSTIDPTDEYADGLAKDPVIKKGEGTIFSSESGKVDYVYKSNDSASDAYSFRDSYVDNSKSEMLGAFTKGGGYSQVGGTILATKNYIKEEFDYYSPKITWAVPYEKYSAVKEGNELHVVYNAEFRKPLYSAERCYGYYYASGDDNYENPLTKRTDMYDGCYFLERIALWYDYTIKDGVITQFTAGLWGWLINLYKDSQYSPADPLPPYVLSDEQIAALEARFIIPETLTTNSGEVIDNPWKGDKYDKDNMYEDEVYLASEESLGSYDLAKLPTLSDYREQDGSDIGVWFDAVAMHDVEQTLED